MVLDTKDAKDVSEVDLWNGNSTGSWVQFRIVKNNDNTYIMLIRFLMGGYHQKTTLGCSLHTIVTLISIIFLSRRILLPQYAVAIVLWLCIIEIWFTTPINTEHRMEYSELQKVRFKLKAMTSLVIISIFVQYSSCGIKNLIVWSVIYQLIEVVVVVLYKLNIINMSFGRKGDSVTLHNAIRRAKRAGILMIASSGNGGSSEEGNVEYPAAYDEVVAVGAVTPEGTLSDMTSTGDELELLAPGEYIKTTGWLDSECISSGTSFAVPHVTAIASLLWQKNFTKSAEYIRNLLKASAKTVTGEDGKEYSLVDYEYACKIYDEYNEQYTEGADAEDIIEEFENTDEADDYSEEVEGRWSRSKHESTVTYASNSAGGLTSTQIEIVKLGSRAPDDYCSPKVYPSHKMLHAMGDHNYVKVYEQIMNMSLWCRKYGHNSSMYIGYPDGNPGANNECETVRRWLGEGEIKVMLNGQYPYNNKNAALIMMGVAMHVVADTFAHKSWELRNGKWYSHGRYPIAGTTGEFKIAHTDNISGENYYNRADDTSCCRSRWTCAQKACAEILAIWNGNCPPSFEEYDIQGYSTKFKLERLYSFSKISCNGIDFNTYSSRIHRLSYAD